MEYHEEHDSESSTDTGAMTTGDGSANGNDSLDSTGSGSRSEEHLIGKST